VAQARREGIRLIAANRAGRRVRSAGLLAVALVAGCGSEDDYANEPRPPAPINITAVITDQKISVSPQAFGAGPIILIVSNQSEGAQKVTFETDSSGGSGPGVRQTTSPINPRGTATLKVDVTQGSYELSVDDANVEPAMVEVGEKRASAQNDLLQP
jgi:hypothetical protein